MDDGKLSGRLCRVVTALLLLVFDSVTAAQLQCDTAACEGTNSPCCSSTFECLTPQLVGQCVYRNGTVSRPDSAFCQAQPTSCYYCCFNNTCNNQAACSNHYTHYEGVAEGVWLFFMGLFLFAFTTCIILLALRHIRLARVRKLKQRHARLAKISLQETSNSSKASQEDRPSDLYLGQKKRNPSVGHKIERQDSSDRIFQPLVDSR